MTYQIKKPNTPGYKINEDDPNFQDYPFLASLDVETNDLTDFCFDQAEVIAIVSVKGLENGTENIIKVLYQEVEYSIPVYIHTDVGTCASRINDNEQSNPINYFKFSPLMFPVRSDVKMYIGDDVVTIGKSKNVIVQVLIENSEPVCAISVIDDGLSVFWDRIGKSHDSYKNTYPTWRMYYRVHIVSSRISITDHDDDSFTRYDENYYLLYDVLNKCLARIPNQTYTELIDARQNNSSDFDYFLNTGFHTGYVQSEITNFTSPYFGINEYRKDYYNGTTCWPDPSDAQLNEYTDLDGITCDPAWCITGTDAGYPTYEKECTGTPQWSEVSSSYKYFKNIWSTGYDEEDINITKWGCAFFPGTGASGKTITAHYNYNGNIFNMYGTYQGHTITTYSGYNYKSEGTEIYRFIAEVEHANRLFSSTIITEELSRDIEEYRFGSAYKSAHGYYDDNYGYVNDIVVVDSSGNNISSFIGFLANGLAIVLRLSYDYDNWNYVGNYYGEFMQNNFFMVSAIFNSDDNLINGEDLIGYISSIINDFYTDESQNDWYFGVPVAIHYTPDEFKVHLTGPYFIPYNIQEYGLT